jgi:hypothetical protein
MIYFLLSLTAITSHAAAVFAAGTKPNITIFLADNLGVNGCKNNQPKP